MTSAQAPAVWNEPIDPIPAPLSRGDQLDESGGKPVLGAGLGTLHQAA